MSTKLHFWFSQKQANQLRQTRLQMPTQKNILVDGLAKLENGKIVQYTEAFQGDSKSRWPDAIDLGLGKIHSVNNVLVDKE